MSTYVQTEPFMLVDFESARRAESSAFERLVWNQYQNEAEAHINKYHDTMRRIEEAYDEAKMNAKATVFEALKPLLASARKRIAAGAE